jgi:hypothetical protein
MLFQVQTILYARQLKYLLIVCSDTREDLERLQPNISEAELSVSRHDITGVIVALTEGLHPKLQLALHTLLAAGSEASAMAG